MAWKTFVAAVTALSLLGQGIPWASGRAAGFSSGNEPRPQVVDRSKRPASSADARKLRKPSDPEAVALLIHLLDRYASEVPDKTELDKRVEQRLSQNGVTRESARRMMANFRKISLSERRAVLGQWAEIPTRERIPESRYRAAFERAAQAAGRLRHPISTDSHPPNPSTRRSPKQLGPNRKPKSLGLLQPGYPHTILTSFRQETDPWDSEIPRVQHISYTPALAFQQPAYPRYMVWYEGLWCHEETSIDGTGDSDQIYIITTVTDEAGNVTTRLHPRPYGTDTYDLMNTSDHRTGPRSRVSGNGLGRRGRPISGLPAQDLTLTVAVFEHDEGDPEETASAVGAAVAIGAASCFLVPVPACLLFVAGAAVLGVVAALLSGGGDDLISTETVLISSSQITQWAAQEPRLKEGEIPYHFSTIHEGGAFDITNPLDGPAGADYHVYFTVREVPPPPAR